MQQKRRSAWEVCAVGEVNGYSVEVLMQVVDGREEYTWRAIKDGKIAQTSITRYETLTKAMHASIEFLDPTAKRFNDADIPQGMWDDLNLLLALEMESGPIKTMEQATEVHNHHVTSLTSMLAAKESIERDFDEAIEAVLSLNHGGHAIAQKLSHMFELMLHEHDILMSVLQREIEVLNSFIIAHMGPRL